MMKYWLKDRILLQNALGCTVLVYPGVTGTPYPIKLSSEHSGTALRTSTLVLFHWNREREGNISILKYCLLLKLFYFDSYFLRVRVVRTNFFDFNFITSMDIGIVILIIKELDMYRYLVVIFPNTTYLCLYWRNLLLK